MANKYFETKYSAQGISGVAKTVFMDFFGEKTVGKEYFWEISVQKEYPWKNIMQKEWFRE